MITQPPPEIDLARRRVRARPRWEIGSPELTLLWLACALASMGLAGYGIHRAVQLWRAAPIGDEWMGVAFYRAWTDRTVTFSGWIAQHNEHRLPFARLLLLVDYLSFGGRAIFSHVANLASYVGLGIALGVIITRHVADRAERAMVIAASVALLVAPAQIANLAFPFQIQMSLVCLLALAAFFATARLGAPATRHAQWAATAVAAVATLLAPYASANGLAASVMAAALAVAIDRPSRLIISAAAALAVGSFFYGYQVPQQGADLLARLQTPAAPANVATFALSFVGSWAQRQGAGAAIALGVAGVALWGAAAVHCTLLWRRHALDAATLTLLALGAFVLASALMAALGRGVEEPSYALATRYGTFSGVFFVSLMGVAWRLAGRMKGARGGRRIVIVAAAAGLLVLGYRTPQELLVLRAHLAKVDAVTAELRGGRFDPEHVRNLHPQPEHIRPLIELLRAHRLSFFAE